MSEWGSRALTVRVFVLVAGGAVAVSVAMTGCCGGGACPSSTFTIESNGRCITNVDSSCDHGIESGWCADAGTRYNSAWVAAAKDAGSPSVCDVRVQLDDGTSFALTVRFTSYQAGCCGLAYEIDPPSVSLTAPTDGGGLLDAHAGDAADF